MKTVIRRKKRILEKPPVYRTPEEISDLVYENYGKCHRQKLTPNTMVFASRMLREEAFSREDLLAIKAIINGDEETAPLSGEILGGEETLAWIDETLANRKR